MKKTIFLCICILTVLLFPIQSIARYHPGWKWRTIRTDNFTIYYPEGHEKLARRVLSLSNEVYDDITGYLGVKPRRCPVVLNPGTDIYNGFFSAFPNRISLFETPSFTISGKGPSSDIIDKVFTHEFTHFAHLTTRLGWYGVLSRVMGDGVAVSNALSPGWIVEGITTNTETLFTDGGRGRCSLFRGEMMSFTEGRGLWSLSSAALPSPNTPPDSRIYLSGYFMVEYLNRLYGDEAFSRLARYQARHPLGATGKAMRHVTKKSPRTFYRGFLADFETHTQNLKRKVLADGLPSGQVVLSYPIESFISHFWTDNETILALRKGYKKKTALVEVNPDTGETVQEKKTGLLNNLVTVRRIHDGYLIFGEVFYHALGDGELDVTDLVLFDPNTNKHSRLTRGEHIYSADLSPDGKTFVAARRNGMWIELILLGADGSHIRPLLSEPGIYCEAPCWSPDGSCIVTVVKSGRNADIALIDPETGETKTLFRPDFHEDNEPSFSPDGRWIVFSSNRSGVWNIHAWDTKEKKLYQLTSVFYAAGNPKISPDSKTLSFLSMYRGVNQLCTIAFKPQEGKELSVEEGSAPDAPDLSRLQPDVPFESKGIPVLEAYRPFVHTPYWRSDEDGVKAGVFFMGGDPIGLNSYNTEILYGLESERPGYDIAITNKSLWPAITCRIYDSAEEGNTVGSGKNRWFRESGGELSLGLDVIHRTTPSSIKSSFHMGSRYRRYYGLNGLTIKSEGDQSLGVFGEMKLVRTPDSARRDMIPQWGQMLAFSHEEGLTRLGGELHGHNTFVSVKQYVPSMLKHQGFEMTVTCQNQNGLLYYDKSMSIPRGYSQSDSEGNLNSRKNLLISLEYHFPLLYTDRGIGLMLYHINLLKGSFFIDYGAGWVGDFAISSWTDKARVSVGATLTTKSALFSWLPVEFGIAAGYKTRDNEWFTDVIYFAL